MVMKQISVSMELRQFLPGDSHIPPQPKYPMPQFLILSARDQIEDKVNGLDLGQPSYLTNPFLPGPEPSPGLTHGNCPGGCMPEMESAYL